ncbi:MAG: L-histidine N(alpha)-methyltransferase [Gemmatimonadota bacterium]
MPDLRQSTRIARNNAMLAEVRLGLTQPQKVLSPKYFYDDRGSRLFEQITRLEEYYPTRTERGLLTDLMPEMIRDLGSVSLVELGAGSAEKSRIILNAMRAAGTLHTCVPIDVSAEFLADTARRLRSEYANLRVIQAVADISGVMAFPSFPRPALFAFLGSTIGNFEDDQAIALLRQVAAAMQPGDSFLMGADLVKNRAVVEAAYNDARGVTAEFNRNILRVLNRELGTNFEEQRFRHQAFFNPAQSRIEMHLIAIGAQVVELPGHGEILFRDGESIRTEISRKFTRGVLDDMFAQAGLAIDRWETDDREWYALMTVRVAPPRRRSRIAGQGRRLSVLRQDLRESAFALTRPAPDGLGHVGAEIEFIALRSGDLRPCPVVSVDGGLDSRGFLRSYGAPLGWREELSPKGTPRFILPGQGTLSFEPGGQLEFSSTTASTATGALDLLRAVVQPLRAAAKNAGIELLDVGIDPINPIDNVPLALDAERYVKMDQYFRTIGPSGARMMRQTAAFHLNLDFGKENMLRWRVLNSAAPYLTAIFANSTQYAGARTQFMSTRAAAWRNLDPARTGTMPAGPVAEDEYLNFALGAPAMLLEPIDGRYAPFIDYWGTDGLTLDDWHEHLSTLFPDIRPRGYLEVRCIDAIPAEWYAAPVVLLAGLLYHGPSLLVTDDLLGSPQPGLLYRAAAAGLTDPDIGPVARDLFEVGLRGARALGEEYVSEEDQAIAEAFFQRFTGAGRSPGSE